MDDFFRQFRENLEQRPAPEFEERDWQGFQRRLDPPAQKRPVVAGWWWLFVPLLAGSLIANGFLFQEILRQQKHTGTVEIHRDTVFLSRLIYQTDTIFQTRTVYQTIAENRPPARLRPFSDLWPTTALGQNKLQFAAFSDHLDLVTPTERPSYRENNQLDSTIYRADFSKNAPPVAVTALPKNQIDSTVVNANFSTNTPPQGAASLEKKQIDSLAFPPSVTQQKKVRKTIGQHLLSLRPTRFETGITAGIVAPFGDVANWQPGPSFNVQAVLGFTASLRMQLQGGFSKPYFNSSAVGPTLGIPHVDPPTPDFQLISVEASQPGLYFSAEMQWLFWPEKRWKPLLGLGLGTVLRLSSQATYDFRDAATGVEWAQETAIPGAVSPIGFGLVTAGVERAITKKWCGLVRGTWQFQPDSGAAKPPGAFEVQAGLRFRL